MRDAHNPDQPAAPTPQASSSSSQRPSPTPPPPGNGPARLDAGVLIRTLAQHRRQRAHTAAYWNEYSLLMRLLCRAVAVLVAGRGPDGRWGVLGSQCPDGWLAGAWPGHLEGLYERATQNGFAFCPVVDGARQQRILALVRTSGADDAVVLMDVPERERANLNELLMRALLASDFTAPEAAAAAPAEASAAVHPALPLAALQAAAPDAAPAAPASPVGNDLIALLDLAAQVMSQPRFGVGAMTLVNGVAAHFKAAQAALGWIDNGAVRVAAVSHLDRFEHNSENVHLLEQLFDASLGQPGHVWHVAAASGAADPAAVAVAGDAHDGLPAALARLDERAGFKAQCVLPVAGYDGRTRAILFLGFAEVQQEPAAIASLQVAMGFLQPWLESVREQDRGAGWRLARVLRDAGERFMGPDFAWGRAGVALAAVLLGVVLFTHWDYHVEASSQLTTDSSRIISAQFDARIDSVSASAGDIVRQGAELAVLDTRDLRQQESDIRADTQRLAAEADKARAAGNLAELEIGEARVAQAEARLARVLHYLSQARAVAPFDGVVVEGERKELMNAPVKKGDRLFKVARIDGLYVEMMVPEREIRDVRAGATGELRLVARPDQPIPFQLSTIIPMAQVKGQEGNHFLIKAKLMQAPEGWWRPGMSGMARIQAGRQSLMWIWTHRLTDNLRMKLWWLGW
jgi:hypothetical protein